jgi:hypothetical protein
MVLRREEGRLLLLLSGGEIEEVEVEGLEEAEEQEASSSESESE